MRTVEGRFWDKVLIGDGCWIWTGNRRTGYGRFRIGGRKGRLYDAHRLSYQWLVGPIPDGYEVDHLCRVRECVRPSHLEAVTPRENRLRSESVAAKNARKVACPKGHPYTRRNSLGSRICDTCINARQRVRTH